VGAGSVKLLDLFCGAGGAAMGYHRAGFAVVGVDIEAQPHYPFEFHQADALTFPLAGFDAIHASPPCQAWTAYKRRRNHVAPRPDLIAAVRERIVGNSDAPYVIENISGAPLGSSAFQLCGSSFGLDVRRHRLFEVWPVDLYRLAPPCDHSRQVPRFPPATNRTNLRSTVEVGVWRIPLDVQHRAMGIDWMTRAELSQAIPPAYTEWVGSQIIKVIAGR